MLDFFLNVAVQGFHIEVHFTRKYYFSVSISKCPVLLFSCQYFDVVVLYNSWRIIIRLLLWTSWWQIFRGTQFKDTYSSIESSEK